jgi:hypothetical protein
MLTKRVNSILIKPITIESITCKKQQQRWSFMVILVNQT